MKAQRTGAMIGFTLGAAAGLCATSYQARNWIMARLHEALTKQERHIIEAGTAEYGLQKESIAARIKRKVKNSFAISARARIIRKQKSKIS